jgi:P4 family phage/plasmid primase-like protien
LSINDATEERTAEAVKLWRHLFGGEAEQGGMLALVSGARDPRTGELVDVQQHAGAYPRGAAVAAEWALGEADAGREVYFCAHLLSRHRRIKQNAARVRALWADLDGTELPDGALKPTAVVESSPGRYHAYWRLTRTLPPDEAEALNRQLTYAIGADRGKWALTTVLRIPGTTNNKREGEPHAVRLTGLEARREQDADELRALVGGAATGRSATGEAGADSSNGDAKAGRAHREPPVPLGAGALAVWRGERPKRKGEGGEVDRSASIFEIGRVLVRAGLNPAWLPPILAERDRALGWGVYLARPQEYERIAAKLAGYSDTTVEWKGRPFDTTDASTAAAKSGFNRTDLGNAERLVARHGEDLRYCHPWRKALVWDGTRWAKDETGAVDRLAAETVRSIYDEAQRESDPDVRKALARHAISSEARSRIDAMGALARSKVPVRPEELDADPWLLNCSNGTVDLRTGELREHAREDLITKLVPIEYDAEAMAPTFVAFLERILPSEELRKFVQRVFGYAALGVVTEEILVIFHGTGDNGKTTLVNVTLEALGDYAIQAARDLLLAKRSTHPTELTDLFGTRFVACTETDDGRRLAEALVKQLTGRERIRARGMREDFWEFNPTHTVFLSTNHKPEVRGTDHAIWRRIRLVPFEVKIPEEEKDKGLAAKLAEELPGILAWIVRGCLEYQREGLGEPEKVEKATAGYRAEMDVLAAFIEDRCVLQAGAEAPATPLYKAYREWCEEAGEQPEKQTAFGRRLGERGDLTGFAYTQGPHKGRKGWRGIGLSHE